MMSSGIGSGSSSGGSGSNSEISKYVEAVVAVNPIIKIDKQMKKTLIDLQKVSTTTISTATTTTATTTTTNTTTIP